MEGARMSYEDDLLSSSTHKTKPARDVPKNLSEDPNNPHLGAIIRKIAQKEARSTYEFEMDNSFIKAAEDALFCAFLSGKDEANDGLRNASVYITETVLTETLYRALDNVFQRSIEKWTDCYTFMDAFWNRVLAASHCVCPVAKFFRAKIEKGSKTWKRWNVTRNLTVFTINFSISTRLIPGTKSTQSYNR